MEVSQICLRVREVIQGSVRKKNVDAMLFSAGLDTSILAYEISRLSKLKLVTVIYESYGLDAPFASSLAENLNLDYEVIQLSDERIQQLLPAVIDILQSFDPMEIRNSIPIYAGLKFAKERWDVKTVMTGDGVDELFFGYSYLFERSDKDLQEYLLYLLKHMHFSSFDLGAALGVEVYSPYLTNEVKSLAVKINPDFKIKDKIGKWILRKAYEDFLPEEYIWREKTPIEAGSGTSILPQLIGQKLSDEYFERKKQYYSCDCVKIRDKEHLYYYEIFKKLEIKIPVKGEKKCPGCGAKWSSDIKFCRTCGAYPI